MIRMLHEYIGDEVGVLFARFHLLHSSLIITFHHIKEKGMSQKDIL